MDLRGAAYPPRGLYSGNYSSCQVRLVRVRICEYGKVNAIIHHIRAVTSGDLKMATYMEFLQSDGFAKFESARKLSYEVCSDFDGNRKWF